MYIFYASQEVANTFLRTLCVWSRFYSRFDYDKPLDAQLIVSTLETESEFAYISVTFLFMNINHFKDTHLYGTFAFSNISDKPSTKAEKR